VRGAAYEVVKSITADPVNGKAHLAKVYYSDAALQLSQWQICTIVQQCLVPDFGLAIGNLTSKTRAKIFDMLALALSGESYKLVLVQSMSNLLLGEMQNWAINCPGSCHELLDEDGLLPHGLLDEKNPINTGKTDMTFAECKKAAADGAKAGLVKHLWVCNDEPRMVHHANVDTQSGRYYLGNVFAEPTIHARNNFFDFISIYGSLKPGEPWGFRYSGHHFDLSFRFDGKGKVYDLPVFLGHNPLMVPRQSPPVTTHEDYINWHNMAGVGQFPDIVFAILKASKALTADAFVPLRLFDSTPENGGLMLKDGKDISDENHLDLSTADQDTFDAVFALIEYTLEFARGNRVTGAVKADFRKSGKMCWTSTGESHGIGAHLPVRVADLIATRSFFYVRAETDELLFFVMVNQLFTLVNDVEPSNHLHSILIPKSYLTHPNGWGPGVTCSLPGVDCSSGTPTAAKDAAEPWQLVPAGKK